ncbi:MAG: serine hydrolase domain-containing protein [Alphaproteobacteria bacterium]
MNEIGLPATTRAYTGAAVTRFHYSCNTALMETAATHLVSGLPLADAIRASNRLGELDPALAAEIEADPTAFYRWDAATRTLSQTIRGYTRRVRELGGLGCVLLPAGFDAPHFDPGRHTISLPATAPDDFDVDAGAATDAAMARALDLAFAPEATTAAVLVVKGGRIVAERYGAGAGRDSMLGSWSMGKTIASLVTGALVGAGRLDLDAEAPVEEWRADPDDPRRRIPLKALVRMSSGLRFSGAREPSYAWGRGAADHQLVYSEAIDSYQFSIGVPVEHPPETIGRYRNCDIATLGLLARRAQVADGLDPIDVPRRHLFDPIGVRRMTMCPDAHGNTIYTGFNYGTARDWARIGQLCLARGSWKGQPVVPASYIDFMATPAPAWIANPEPLSDFHHVYGGGIWLNRTSPKATRSWSLPEDAMCMSGAGGQRCFVVPSLDMVVVRLGHMRGVEPDARTDEFLAALGRIVGSP